MLSFIGIGIDAVFHFRGRRRGDDRQTIIGLFLWQNPHYVVGPVFLHSPVQIGQKDGTEGQAFRLVNGQHAHPLLVARRYRLFLHRLIPISHKTLQVALPAVQVFHDAVQKGQQIGCLPFPTVQFEDIYDMFAKFKQRRMARFFENAD